MMKFSSLRTQLSEVWRSDISACGYLCIICNSNRIPIGISSMVNDSRFCTYAYSLPRSCDVKMVVGVDGDRRGNGDSNVPALAVTR